MKKLVLMTVAFVMAAVFVYGQFDAYIRNIPSIRNTAIKTANASNRALFSFPKSLKNPFRRVSPKYALQKPHRHWDFIPEIITHMPA